MDRPWRYSSTVVQVSSSWPGLSGVKTLIVLGDSYCDVGYDFRTSPLPSVDEPLGVPFPGLTYAEDGQPNWVGHFVTRLKDQTRLVVYDFARGGDTTDGVERQIKREFLPNLADNVAKGLLQNNLDRELQTSDTVWNSNDTLFGAAFNLSTPSPASPYVHSSEAIWVGINDCGYSAADRISPKVTKLFGLIDILFKAGARNMMLIDIPPMHRSPAMSMPPRGKLSFEEWNDCLRARAADFVKTRTDATLVIYSSWATFTRVLNDPAACGFSPADVKRRGGSIWVDHIHPTSKMHDEIAKDAVELLQTVHVNDAEA
ncbi:carbohydrate esterase family 16 protein [Phanerochaete sordida]|uniref:Carbohydrate esterase family 16 protein n=1 Tax=Phanerochaete sordida TaxID=48140 RepID=A0A9P3G3W2_9APHY|nr:carbohydrate esterase family 16 protein [Phanerochaete sordida]